ncbi:septal ring lytic transglycosylase RlpA family protein [Carboxylicivirga sp. M1479]|uniref:septal ring lytic transglycosylase RlpA family protein n=1 Tax=Carboxylicivirga sp. M1479 TaxID=2594476 RepID=UPI0011789EBB|nr:septal ring lytic transglycosylase RlpA family protein [Carboxylicivirga sp. M1479]TRX72402.1 septal ring lytic transglycosylase RlpA family protein [Carboxylicivirga sp. M1479]
MRFLLLILFALQGVLVLSQAFEQTGKASYYADKFEGRPTASGQIFSNKYYTAAHKTLPFGSKVVVTNLQNNKTVTVTINDRGPFIKGRIIDLSVLAATELDFVHQGIARVRIEMAHQSVDEDDLLVAINNELELVQLTCFINYNKLSKALITQR